MPGRHILSVRSSRVLRPLGLVLLTVLTLSLAAVGRGHAQELEPSSGSHSDVRRVATELGFSMLGVAAAAGAGVAVAKGVNRDCDHDFEDLFCGFSGAVGGAVLASQGGLALAVAGAYVPHYLRGGRGRWWTAMLGGFLGFGLGAGAVAIVSSQSSERPAFAGAVVLAGTLLAATPVLILELDHRGRERDAHAAGSAPRVGVSAVPMPRGAAVSVAGRF